MTQNNMNRTKGYHGSGRQKVAYYVSIFFYIVQTMLVFRFAFKLLGANESNRFVTLLYSTTAPVTRVFDGIFSEIFIENYEILHIFEPSSVIALVVTIIIAGIVNRLLVGRDPGLAVPINTVDTTVMQPQNTEEEPPSREEEPPNTKVEPPNTGDNKSSSLSEHNP